MGYLRWTTSLNVDSGSEDMRPQITQYSYDGRAALIE